MSIVPVIGFAALALLAIAFAVLPLFKLGGKRKALLLGAIAVFMLAVGGGTYWLVGRPHLAQRSAQGLNTREVNGLIPYLIERTRKAPNDDKAWRYLAQAYMTARDYGDAAKALSRVIALVGKGDPVLDAAYGEALVLDAGGAVPDAAQGAFIDALKVDPTSAPARFYMGLARAQARDTNGALQYWKSLLADTPPDTPLHQMLLDRVAAMTAATGGMPQGGPQAMVAKLEARLKADPKDGPGWVRLVRAWHVLGDDTKARAALNEARKAFAGDRAMLAAFDTAEKDLSSAR